MELDDFKPAWNLMQQRLDATHALVVRSLTESRLDKIRSSMRPQVMLLILELGLGILACVGSSYFSIMHLEEARFAVPGVVLLLVSALVLMGNVRQLDLLSRIDYAGPILVIQRQISEFRSSRVRLTLLVLVTSPLIWVPLAIVGAKWLLGFDIYRTFGAAWVIANVVFGALVLAAGIWASRRWASRLADIPVLSRLADELAGRSLVKVRTQFEELARFESEA